MILNAFFFVPFFRGLEFWELKFRSRSFLYRQVRFGAAFGAHFASKDQSAAVTITTDRFGDVASLCGAVSVTEMVSQLRDTHGDVPSER